MDAYASTQTNRVDVARFDRLSNGFLCQHPEAAHVIGDIRYGMPPTSTVPLWGIKINRAQPDEPVRFVKYREANKADLNRFYQMLFRRGEFHPDSNESH